MAPVTMTSRRVPAVLLLVVALAVSALLVPSGADAHGDGPRRTTAASVGSCAGFKNRTGVNRRLIHLGNASDISGPVPGLFADAQRATKAYVAYFNAHHSICGRKLKLDLYDSRTDAASDKTATTRMCAKDFAAVGSMSAFDSGGASTAQACGLPDLRVASATPARNGCHTCFGVRATRTGEAPNSLPDYFVANFHDASQKAAMVYLNVGSAARSATDQVKVDESRGMKFLYVTGIDVADFNYSPYVQQMRSKGVQWVQFVGAYQQAVRLAQAFQAAGYHPRIQLSDTAYNNDFATSGGSAVDGTVAPVTYIPLDRDQAQMNLYRRWLGRVSPGARPSGVGLYAWSAAKLFVTEALGLGGRLSRASLVRRLKTVKDWTGGGLHARMAVGAKHVSPCLRFVQLHGRTWTSFGGTSFKCSGISTAG